MNAETKRTPTSRGEVRSPQWEVTDRSVSIDDFTARCDLGAGQHLVVNGPPEVAYPAIRHLDLLTIRSRIARLARQVVSPATEGARAWLRATPLVSRCDTTRVAQLWWISQW